MISWRRHGLWVGVGGNIRKFLFGMRGGYDLFMFKGVLVECVLALAFENRYRSSRTWDWDMIRVMNEVMVLRCTRELRVLILFQKVHIVEFEQMKGRPLIAFMVNCRGACVDSFECPGLMPLWTSQMTSSTCNRRVHATLHQPGLSHPRDTSDPTLAPHVGTRPSAMIDDPRLP